ncbi:hypothetical protein F3F93_01545 [Mariprofundus sp. KV]|nr:hypothetical protein [Mariprofundus sp. KV]
MHLLRGAGHRHGVSIGHHQAESGGKNLHGKQADHQSGKATHMQFANQHAAQVTQIKMNRP